MDKATLMPQCSPGLSAYFLLSCVASSGNWHFKTAHFIFLGNEELVLALALALALAQAGRQWEKGQPPPAPPPAAAAEMGTLEGTKALRHDSPPPGRGLGLPRKGSRWGALGSCLSGQIPSSHMSWASEGWLITLSRPSEGGK